MSTNKSRRNSSRQLAIAAMIHACITTEHIALNDVQFSRPLSVSTFTQLLGNPSKVIAADPQRTTRAHIYDEFGIKLWERGGLIGGVEFVICHKQSSVGAHQAFNGQLRVGGVNVTVDTLEQELAKSSIPFRKTGSGTWRYKTGYRFITFESLGRTGASGRRSGRPRYVTSVSAFPGCSPGLIEVRNGETRGHDEEFRGSELRPATRDISGFRTDVRRMQLIVAPSFADAVAWEIRNGSHGWRLYRATVLQPGPDAYLVGYDRLSFPSDRLAAYFEQIIRTSLPIAPDLSGTCGFDGTTYQLAVFGDKSTSWRFQWWSTARSNWGPLAHIVSEMVSEFSSAPIENAEAGLS